ncbi:MAG TPA: metalloregulator ArsR/SmtB family transcription factor [Pirellulales bacterium]|jgi:ArsR family transcriptional regulator|nr:metalloregulator ArsR/SmtB family transcription factor [Pirellulales bacterium]
MKIRSPLSLASSAGLLKALADPVRLRILNLLSDDREVCVCHLHAALELPQPTVSRHLAYLRKRGLVAGRKDGLWVHYRLAAPKSSLQRSLLSCLAPRLERFEESQKDRQRLERLSPRCE